MPPKPWPAGPKSVPTPGAFALGAAALAELIGPLSAADDALARLDERLRNSSVRDGLIARTDFAEACAALWAEGELVQLEDLVLHDAGMDIRSPSHELVQAHAYLRLRRKAARGDPKTLLSPTGILTLVGRTAAHRGAGDFAEGAGGLDAAGPPEPGRGSNSFGQEVTAQTTTLTAQNTAPALPRRVDQTTAAAPSKDYFVYHEDWDEEAHLGAWCASLGAADRLPPILGALGLALTWQAGEPLQRQARIAPLLAGLYLRRCRRTNAHLVSFNLGLRSLRPPPRRARTSLEQLRHGLATVEAGARETLAQHDRLMLARQVLERKCRGRRENSKMPRLAGLLLNSPLVSVPMIAQNLEISQQAAQMLVENMGSTLREITGRRRYRAWTIG